MAAHTGFVREQTYPMMPSQKTPSNFRVSYSCYDAETLRSLNCALTQRLVGIKEPRTSPDNNGGHNHGFDTHPLIQPANGALRFSGTDTDPDPLAVRGQTQNTEVMITHPMPEAAGKIIAESTLTAPPGWECMVRCFTFNSSKYRDTFDVGVPGLTKLPASTAFHITARGGTGTHPEGTWGTMDAVGRLVLVAKEYFDITGRRLSINDLSLPKGGRFDINNNWIKPHASHRTGTDADINRADEGGVKVACQSDNQLEEAVREANRLTPPVSLLCEDGGLKHIDFD
ncbi:MAG: penicillin-insensitive murein endopeptidase [Gammaproteobacteria bacterium]|nr:penicillin-insensitive murein endopeptidase [Gammaproteobacteria bacterium]